MSAPFPQVPPEVIAALAKETQSPLIIGLTAAATGLALVAVLLRFFTRIRFVGSVGSEDHFVALSMVFSGCASACLIQGARYGNGRHLINVPMENGKFVLLYLYFGIIAYHFSLFCTKMSILLQYRRIFTLKDSRKPIYIVMGICVATALTAIICAIFTCIPVDSFWNLYKMPYAKCMNKDAMYHANAGFNIFTDLLVAALPVRALWKLQIPMRQKVALIMILTLGWFVVIISALRLHFLILVAKHPKDQTWYSGPAAYWSALEVNLAIVCACAPALKPLIVRVVPAFGTRFGGSKPAYASSSTHPHTIGTYSSRNFMRLKAKASQSSMPADDEIHLDSHSDTPTTHANGNGHGHGHGHGDVKTNPESWREIYVTQSVEQHSLDRTGSSSPRDLENQYFPPGNRAQKKGRF